MVAPKKLQKISSEELAEVYLYEIITNNELAPKISLTFSDKQKKEDYDYLCRLSRLALVLMATMDEAYSNPKFALVQDNLETQIFDDLAEEKAEELTKQLRRVMTDLKDLLKPKEKNKELTWAKTWLSRIGWEITNPADLLQISCYWMDLYVVLVKSFNDYQII